MDRRHGKNFLDVFPEFTEFYEKCRQNKNDILKEEHKLQ